MGLGLQGWAALYLGEYEQARRCFKEALALAEEQQDRNTIAVILYRLARLSHHTGSYAEAVQYAQEALAIFQDSHFDQSWASDCCVWKGLALVRMGKLQEAQAVMQEALEVAREMGFGISICLLTAHLGLAAYALKDYVRARTLHLEALGMVQETSSWQEEKAFLLGDLGRIEIALEHDQEAEACFLQSLKIALPYRWQDNLLATLAGLAELRAKQGQVEAALKLANLVIHHPVTEYVHKERLKGLVAELQDQLPEKAVAEALARGKAMDLEKTVERILRQSSLEA